MISLGPLLIDLSGKAITPDEQDLLRSPAIGGVVLFSRNYESPEQLASLTEEIHALRSPPLLIAVDQEGGRIQRFRSEFSPLPSPRALGMLWDRDRAEARRLAQCSGWVGGLELRSAGLDICFAPVVDFWQKTSTVIGDRAFSSNPKAVTELALSWIRGLERGGIRATLKHFPGHGGVPEDTHQTAAADTRSMSDLMKHDLIPYRDLIGRLPNVCVMTAHVFFPVIDPRPASLSKYWIQEVLRKEMQLQGAVISDDLTMHALDTQGSLDERARLALLAGSDLILACNARPTLPALLRSLRDYHNPVSRLRLMHLHRSQPLARSALLQMPVWRESVKLLEAFQARTDLFPGERAGG
ncbi:MAG: beta-N-acetylhexosaminidase [Gammaproteobacteria bacterium]